MVAGDHSNDTRAPTAKSRAGCLIDANGRVGSIASQSVGPVEPQEEDAGGELLHDFLGKCGLLAANTFDGTGRRKWVTTRGQEARLDHVVGPQRWLQMLHRTKRLTSLVSSRGQGRPPTSLPEVRPAR